MQHLIINQTDTARAEANLDYLSKGWRVISVTLYSHEWRPAHLEASKNNNGEPITQFALYAAIVLEKD